MLTYVDTLIGFAGVMLLLSLLITLLVQVAVSVLNLRGLSLLWGVTLVVERAKPGLKSTLRAWDIAWQVLTHPALSPQGRLAPALRSEELARVLDEIEGGAEKLGLRGRLLRFVHQVRAKGVESAEEAKQAAAAAKVELASLQKWFDTVMDRTTERFTAHTRAITFVIAAALSFGLHIDSIALLRQISGNPELRARLAQSADATLKVADEVSVRGEKGATLATDALKKAASDNPTVKLEAPIPEKLSQRAEGKAWLDLNVKDHDGHEAFEKAYQKSYDAAVQARLPELYATAAKVKEQLADTQLDLLSSSHESWNFTSWKWLVDHHAHLFGVIMSTLFLSMGAPFWYNMLRQLANLRPMLAGKVDTDEKGEKKPEKDAKAGA
jgi:hypothetical protein